MKTLHLITITALLLANCLNAESELPFEAKQLIHKRDIALIRMNEGLQRELEKVKIKFTKRGDLYSANKIAEYIQTMQESDSVNSGGKTDPVAKISGSWRKNGGDTIFSFDGEGGGENVNSKLRFKVKFDKEKNRYIIKSSKWTNYLRLDRDPNVIHAKADNGGYVLRKIK